MKKIKFNKKIKQFLFTFGILLIIFSLAFVPSVSAINEQNIDFLSYNFLMGYSTDIVPNPNFSATDVYDTYRYNGTNQIEFKSKDGSNVFNHSYYRYCGFNLKSGSSSQSYTVTIKFVSYYGRSGETGVYGFDSTPAAWVNNVRYNGSYFPYSQVASNGNVFDGGQFSFQMSKNTVVSVVLMSGFNEVTSNLLGYNIIVDVTPNQSTVIEDALTDEDYDNFSSQQGEIDDFNDAETEVRDFANDNMDQVKGDLFDSNLLNPEVNSPIKGFRAISMIFDTFLEDNPRLAFMAKLSISFGILAFVLGLAMTIKRRSK